MGKTDPTVFTTILELIDEAENEVVGKKKGAERKAKTAIKFAAMEFIPKWVPRPMRRAVATWMVQGVFDLARTAVREIQDALTVDTAAVEAARAELKDLRSEVRKVKAELKVAKDEAREAKKAAKVEAKAAKAEAKAAKTPDEKLPKEPTE